MVDCSTTGVSGATTTAITQYAVGLGDPGRHELRRAPGHSGGHRPAALARAARGRAVHRHRPGGRHRPAAAGRRFHPHRQRRQPGWDHPGDPAGLRAGLGQPTAPGRRQRQPGAGARHRPRRLRPEPADRRPRPRVRPHAGNRDRAWRRGRPGHGGRRCRRDRQALPGPRPGQRQHRHHRRSHRLGHHPQRRLPGAVPRGDQRRRPVRDDVDGHLLAHRPRHSGRVLEDDRHRHAARRSRLRRGDHQRRPRRRGPGRELLTRPAGGRVRGRRRRHGADGQRQPGRRDDLGAGAEGAEQLDVPAAGRRRRAADPAGEAGARARWARPSTRRSRA